VYVLGISAFYHDAAAALLDEGVLVAAAQEERFSRLKFDHRFPENAIAYCLRQAGITAADLDYVVFYEKPLPKFERILTSALSTFPHSLSVFREAMLAWMTEKLWLKSLLRDKLGIAADHILFVEHHVSHAASAVFCSPFQDMAVLTLDGVGEWTTTTLGRASANWDGSSSNSIELFEEQRFPHSIGMLYSAFTAWLGFEVNSGEYKVMGMAPYGEPRYLDKMSKVIQVFDDGSYWLDMRYFAYHRSITVPYGQRFVDLFGAPRVKDAPFFTARTGDDIRGRETDAAMNQYYADVAASLQHVVEDLIIKIARALHRKTGAANLTIAGGVALNSVANGRVMRETPFEQVYIQPNAGDAGGALGAALYVWHVVLGHPRKFIMEHAYYGEGYDADSVARFLTTEGIAAERFLTVEAQADAVVDALLRGQVIGLAHDRFEWGPRALGNRSILADPRRAEMKDIVNTKIKFREPFRPFAPVVPEDQAAQFFDMQKAEGQYPQRFMLMVSPVFPEAEATIPAVSHMGTSRLQTIRREWNPLYYEIVRRFGEATGVPVLMNTSFNLSTEPIVATPANAMSTFQNSGIDVLALDGHLVRKSEAGDRPA
jgi:carbamoyltransferase